DFAYMVHTDVGHACVGARINGKMVPLRQRLKNGDIVEIMTQAGHKPSRDWLSLAVTSRARNKIKHFLHHEEKTRSIDLGRKLFEREARRFDVNLKTVLDTAALTKAATESGLPRIDDLFAAIGYGRIAPRQALLRIVPPDDLKEKAPDSALTSAVKRVFKADADKIKVRGADDLLVFRARCCNPIRGEKIVGYITRGKGVSVHASTCSNVTSLLYDPDRRIEVEWDKGENSTTPAYTVRLTIQVEDRKGILAEVSSKVAGINTNIKTMEATTDEREGRIDMTVEINDLKHLEKVIKSLRGVDGVLNVERSTR
ncbi:MAG: bifunctional (p)ppGpp synthetase/guanosine-3',5'-bis(diphosphate) 3'-pyrophosphohydrolase, partial [Acidobacteria bacterium]|nr:bifunctional (p)ppGpp synthetase/guanosine-3',5'-bis(diphosphate) 3'-pyrophosphohydrolase [Acidobacteriota bacterium]